MAPLPSRRLFDDALVRITDVCCRAPASPCGHEEHARGHVLVLTRVGAFVKHTGPRARREVVGEPLHALCFNALEPYRVSHPADGGDDCTTLEFSAHTLLDATAALDPWRADDPARPFRISHAPLSPALLLRFRRLWRTLHRTDAPLDPLAIEEASLGLLGDLLDAGHRAHGLTARSARRVDTARDRRDLVERAKETLAARPAESLSLAGLARAVHSSPFHLARVFHEHVGWSIHQYRLRLRLAVALERMDAGDESLGAVALALGFASHAHFTNLFRRTYGVAPSAVRR